MLDPIPEETTPMDVANLNKLLNELERSHRETEREQTLDISREIIRKERADTYRRK